MAIDPNQAAPLAPPVAPQQNTPPVAQPDVTSADTTGQGGTPAIVTSTAKPALPAGSQINTDPNAIPGTAEPKHGALGDILQTLAGGKKISYRQTDAGPVQVTENLKPGEVARSILASALIGLAGGYSPEARGKGPGAAAAAGFQAEQQHTEQQQKEAKDEAQKQFQNTQTADELTIRKMQNAREQQRSIQEAQEHDLRMDEMKQNLEQGKTEGAQRVVEFQQKQADRVNLLSQLGVKPLQFPDGTPVPEFNSTSEAMDWANKNAALAIQPGKYNTIVEVDPHTNRYMIMQKPVGWDDPQWLGVKTQNGVPVKDKNGDFIPDGTFKDINGKVVAPAGQLTPRQMYDSQVRLIEMQDKKLSLQEAVERLKTARMARSKDEQQNTAEEHWNAAEGNPDAIDPKTHQFILTPTDRMILQARFVKDYSAAAVALTAAQKELERDPDDASTKQEVANASAIMQQEQTNHLLLSRTPNVADVMANNIKTQFTSQADGFYDQEAALRSVDAMSVSSGVKQSIRQKLTIPQADRLSDPKVFDAFVSTAEDRMAKGESVDNIISGINITRNFSANDKQRAIAAIRAKQQADKTPPVGGSVDAVKAIAGGIKNAIQNPAEPPEPVAAQ